MLLFYRTFLTTDFRYNIDGLLQKVFWMLNLLSVEQHLTCYLCICLCQIYLHIFILFTSHILTHARYNTNGCATLQISPAMAPAIGKTGAPIFFRFACVLTTDFLASFYKLGTFEALKKAVGLIISVTMPTIFFLFLQKGLPSWHDCIRHSRIHEESTAGIKTHSQLLNHTQRH